MAAASPVFILAEVLIPWMFKPVNNNAIRTAQPA
jgi:hypothetical protein